MLLDNLSNLVELGDDNSAGQMQPFNMMVTKARKQGCSMGIIHHTGKAMTIGPDGIPTWREVMIWQLDWIRPYVFFHASHHLMDM